MSPALDVVREHAASATAAASAEALIGSAAAVNRGVFASIKGADVVMMLLTLSIVLRVFNYHFTRIPSSIAMALGSIVLTGVLLLLNNIPQLGLSYALSDFRLFLMDFPDLVLNYMLGFLLFAAAVEVDLRALGRIFTTVVALSVGSTALSTLIISVLTYLLMQSIAHMDFAWCLLFGAIVSPTDPVTVISILNDKPDLLPASTRYFVVGESLLNDAVGVVLYLVFVEIVEKPDIRPAEVLYLLFETVFVECVFGAIIGVALAWLAYSAMKSVKDVLLEVAITFVLVGNINMICRLCHASIPLASVFAGLFMGNYGVSFAMEEPTIETFHEMWKMADETLNSILFLMIGAADLFWNPQDLGWSRVFIVIICTICISLFARCVSVALPLLSIIFLEWLTGRRLRHRSVRYRGGTIAVLTWAGMRGGISIALALGVPDAFVRHAVPGHMTYGQLIFFMTFILVVFSITVQGVLFEPVVRMVNRVSYEIMPSGGLGTYVSSMSLVDPNNGLAYDDFDDDTVTGDLSQDDIMRGGEVVWDTRGSFYHDYDSSAPVATTPLISTFVNNDGNLFSDPIPPPPQPIYHASRINAVARSVSIDDGLSQPLKPPSAIPERLSAAERHGRQASETFVDLAPLEEPPSIALFFGDLRRKGTSSLRMWFDQQANRNTRLPESSGDVGGSLRRSRTEPDNARLARTDITKDTTDLPLKAEHTATTVQFHRTREDKSRPRGRPPRSGLAPSQPTTRVRVPPRDSNGANDNTANSFPSRSG